MTGKLYLHLTSGKPTVCPESNVREIKHKYTKVVFVFPQSQRRQHRNP